MSPNYRISFKAGHLGPGEPIVLEKQRIHIYKRDTCNTYDEREMEFITLVDTIATVNQMNRFNQMLLLWTNLMKY